MTIDPVTGIAGKEVASLTVKAASWGIQYAHQWYRSYSLLILGQERSGKTTLYDFLRKRLLGERGRVTRPTIDNVNSGTFSLEWKTPSGVPLLLEFRNIGDRAGQIGPYEHARMLVRAQPHIVIVVLDITSPPTSPRFNESYLKWCEAFTSELSDILMNKPGRAKKVNSRLHQMIILLNKTDELSPHTRQQTIDDAKEKIRETIQDALRRYFGTKVDFFPIMPCIMVQNPLHGTEADTWSSLRSVFEELARAVR